MPEATVILNPTAGRGAGERLSSQIVEQLQGYGLALQLVTTEAPGHATELAREAAALGRETVVAVGGDGTVNEVLNGLMQASEGANGPALGVVPIGTGNDFAYGADLPLELSRACLVVAQGKSRTMDVGWVRADTEEDRYFCNGVGLGFDAIANIESRKLKRLRGSLLYLVAVIRTLAFYYHAPTVEVTIDDQEIVQPSLMLSIMNGRRFGGSFMMTPGAQIDDGRFDLCVTDEVPRLKMVAFVPRFMRGSHVTDRNVTMFQAQSVAVVCDSPWASHVDGEIYGVGARRFEMTLLPQRLRLIC